jgi:hypothetical protein
MQPSVEALLRLTASALLLTLIGCSTAGTPVTACDQLCDELMGECSYAAFPDRESCLQGCLYNESERANTDAHLTCVEEALCDTFAIVECENQHGANSDD